MLALLAAGASAQAASAVNLDQEPRTLIVTEGGSKSELTLGGGESVDFCPSGCFVTMPNGDIEALTGSETEVFLRLVHTWERMRLAQSSDETADP